jgi:hypothetical protein
MKTTIELPDVLLDRARRLAQREGASLKAVIEEGLHLVLKKRAARPAAKFRIEPFKGEGLTPEFSQAGWEAIRDEIYRDRG